MKRKEHLVLFFGFFFQNAIGGQFFLLVYKKISEYFAAFYYEKHRACRKLHLKIEWNGKEWNRGFRIIVRKQSIAEKGRLTQPQGFILLADIFIELSLFIYQSCLTASCPFDRLLPFIKSYIAVNRYLMA